MKINGLSVFTYGSEEKRAIIFIHGFPYEHSMWENQIELLKKDYFCITYDVRGLGESSVGDGQYTMESYVDDLFTIIKELKLNKPILCGLSMGGYISLRAVEREQNLFSALILCDTKSEADDDAARLKRAAGISQINSGEFLKFIDTFVTNCFAEETPKEDEKMFFDTLFKAHKNDPVGVKGAIIAIMCRTDTTLFLPKIKLPTLVICGSFDKLTPPVVMRPMAEKIQGSEFAIVPRAGHMTPLENPDNFNDLISGFLKRI
ncbi:MAG: alpha/beta hydrolase [Ignavibacteriae bacterium HGW-Ignavibacteriae-3]|nr:MAG: alpha/beta hydrolase [Ignavibacteriae bacterium HGW-Ignavibacteriae-3]